MIAALTCGLLTSFVLDWSAPAVADTASDTQTVYCLAEPQRASLIAAAVALGLVQTVNGAPDRIRRGNSTLTVDGWRKSQPKEFRRACSALFASVAQTNGGAPAAEKASPVSSMLGTLIPALAGALFAWAFGETRDAKGRRLLAGQSLRTATTRFQDAVGTFLDGWSIPGSPPSPSPVREAKTALDAELRALELRWPHWSAPQETRERLGRLPDSLGDGWVGDTEGTNNQIAEVRKTVELIDRAADRMAVDLAKAFWWVRRGDVDLSGRRS